jgi:RHS repeat-associated protein
MPLAVVTTGGTLSWVHGDHLGTPILMTNATGMAIAQPSGYTTPAFPGQSKTLADLYYNRHRDYDPTTGRYIQADPIGLAGGAIPYSYAMNNPLRYTDPYGQNPLVIGRVAIGVAVYFGASALWWTLHPMTPPMSPPVFTSWETSNESCPEDEIRKDRLHPSSCAGIYAAIDRSVPWIQNKEYEQANGTLSGIPGHHRSILNYVRTLRSLVTTAELKGCYNYNPDARRMLAQYPG